ncbi:rab3 GTPase-activating protein non-catalytic subunit [Dorcoceras hygrometricum]|uniref:Rab3 GTPase-activating protein non-catalytic subunit n=1 Tax=Dorcoceras hygrometricum TaxID=472368 RepID=A0A2Z7BCL4_9LAMI|nr:rab3 GTPase-activating protein non-catalytic subunit [Dorcoceras hygrometricum]
MSRRYHTTELGCIAGVDLSDLGAGKEGWLVENANLLVSLDTRSLAIANRSLILLIQWSNSRDGRADPDNNRTVKILPDLSPIEAEYISAVESLFLDDDTKVLAVGTSCGYLLIYSFSGRLIHRQFVNSGRILKLRVRGIKQDLTRDASSEEVCVVMPGVIARFEGSDIMNLLQRWFHGTPSRFWDEDLDDGSSEDSRTVARLPYQLWNVSKYGLCADAAITGVMPPPLMEIQSSQRYYRAVTVGDDAVISAFRLSVDKSRSLVGAILSKVVPATFSTIASFSKLIWRSEEKPTKKPEAKFQPFAKCEIIDSRSGFIFRVTSSSNYQQLLFTASPLTCLKDHPRKGEKLTLSPSGTLAAVTDSLGRILLLDTQALVVVRLWKGYREACCFFVEMLASKDNSRPASYEYSKSDYCLCLAIHAPRKGIVEVVFSSMLHLPKDLFSLHFSPVWQMRTGPRLLTVPCPRGSKILQPTYRFTPAMSSSSSYVPLEVFFLNGDSGQVSVLNRFIH